MKVLSRLGRFRPTQAARAEPPAAPGAAGSPVTRADAEAEAAVRRFDWYHTIELPSGVVTPGKYDHRRLVGDYGFPDDLRNKTALDVGPGHGFFAFELERRGAAVTALELPKWRDHDAGASLRGVLDEGSLDAGMETYLHGALDFAIQAMGSRVLVRHGSVYDLSPARFGVFDVVFCGSLLIHLRDPLRALSAIRSVTRDRAIVETVIDADESGAVPRAVFYGASDGMSFWAPNMACLERWLSCAGFGRVARGSTFRLASRDGEFDYWHGVAHAFVS